MGIAIIYARVSTEEQARKGYSLPEQVSECRKKAAELGATQNLEFIDEVSGEILDRAGLSAARDAVRRGGITWFICLTADRFSRKLAHQLMVAEEIKRRNVQLIFTQHGYNDTPEGRFFFSIFGAVAELEKEKIQERTSRGRRGKWKTGKLAQYLDVYGYDMNMVDDVLIVNEQEARWVRQMYEWSAYEGLGPYSICQRLNDLKVRAPRGDWWHKSTVTRILQNETYIGKLTLNRRNWTGVSLNKHRPADERVALTWRDPSEWFTFAVAPLIDVPLFNKVQLLIERGKRIKPATAQLLTGLCICELCGGRLHYKPHSKRKDGPTYYYIFCEHKFPSSASVRREKCALCTLRMIPAQKLESWVWDQIRGWLEAPETVFTLWEARHPETGQQHPLQLELERVEAQLTHIKTEHGRLVALVTKGLTTLEMAEPELRELIEGITRMQHRRSELHNRLAQSPKQVGMGQHRKDEIQELSLQLHGCLADLNTEGRAGVIRDLVRTIRVNGPDPKEWTITCL